MRPLNNRYPNASVFVRDSSDGILGNGPVVKELVVCLTGLGNVEETKDLVVIPLSSKDAIRHALKLLEHLNFEEKWL